MAVDHFNEAGGVGGCQIRYVLRDDQGSPNVGVDAAKTLVEIEKVPVVLGAIQSGVSLPVLTSVTVPSKVTQISCCSSAPSFTELAASGGTDGYWVRTLPTDRPQAVVMANIAREKGYKNIAIVSHSLGATMANQYLIKTDDKTVKAWVFIGIINGLEEMFRIKIPVLDVFGSKDWEITQVGAYERKKQIMKIKGSDQVVVPDALHFFEGREEDLTKIVVNFLDQVFHQGNSTAAAGR